MKTIAAITTPLIPSAIHIIRISGPETYLLMNKLLNKPLEKQSYKIEYHSIIDPTNHKTIDHVLLNLFTKPHSFTGEDTIEINCHGSVVTSQKILDLLINLGCEQAKPGEFSMQALMNNKMNYYQIEALNNFIHAPNQTASQLALKAMGDKDHNLLSEMREQIFKITGSIEVNIDYPEYDDVPQYTHLEIIELLTPIIKELQSIYTRSCQLMPVFEGYKVAIIGKPNVGKSSLLNLLSRQEKAIVSHYQGTTRDVVEATINFHDLTIKLQDTAGIRETLDPLELMGINKTKEAINNANLIMWLVDDSYNAIDQSFEQLLINKAFIKIQNKKELSKINHADILISVANNDIQSLLDALAKRLQVIKLNDTDGFVLQSHRQINLIKKIIGILNSMIVALEQATSLDLLQSDFEQCLRDFDLILGKNFEYDKLDELFKHFCLGK